MRDQTDVSREDDIERQRVYRRTLGVVAFSQMLSGLGIAAGVTVGALLVEEMLGSTGLSGLPSALFTLGAASAAMLIGRLSQHRGRRLGLSVGYLAGAIGGAGVVIAALIGSPVLLFVSLFVYGSGMSTSLLARYAGADLATPDRRGQAVSIVLVATTFGAVVGPNIVGPMGDVARAIGVPELAGPFLLASSAYAFAGLVLTILLRPDPLLFARQLALNARESGGPSDTGPAVVRRRGLLLGGSVLVVANIVMLAVMTMTPIHMRHHGHSLSATGLVIAVHVAGMFLFSPVTGYLVDRVGRIPMMMASGLTLLASGVMAAFAPVDSVAILALALGLLGLGWNFGLVSGTAMVTDSTPLETRASTQGTVDVCVALSGAGGGALSGVIVATSSYTVLALAGGALALLLIPVIVLVQAPRATVGRGQAST